ncbi:MAG: hypothetical protein MPK62_05920 [Alphaproteobacteria bacterium]|nr:hypothetical protein [Alphaproteobacteria bacterium]
MARFANPERLSLPQAKYRVFLGGCQAVSGYFLDIFCRAESIENEGFMAVSGQSRTKGKRQKEQTVLSGIAMWLDSPTP